MSKENKNTEVNKTSIAPEKKMPDLSMSKGISGPGGKYDDAKEKKLKEDFRDEDEPVEPLLDKDGNEIGGEG